MDYLVISTGPAGLQLGSFLQRAGRDYEIIEAGHAPGTFFRTFPRHRKLISINKPHAGTADRELNLRMHWNSLLSDDPELLFTNYTDKYFPDADDLVRYLKDFARDGDFEVDDQRVLIIRKGNCAFETARYYEEMPVAYMPKSGFAVTPVPSIA